MLESIANKAVSLVIGEAEGDEAPRSKRATSAPLTTERPAKKLRHGSTLTSTAIAATEMKKEKQAHVKSEPQTAMDRSGPPTFTRSRMKLESDMAMRTKLRQSDMAEIYAARTAAPQHAGTSAEAFAATLSEAPRSGLSFSHYGEFKHLRRIKGDINTRITQHCQRDKPHQDGGHGATIGGQAVGV